MYPHFRHGSALDLEGRLGCPTALSLPYSANHLAMGKGSRAGVREPMSLDIKTEPLSVPTGAWLTLFQGGGRCGAVLHENGYLLEVKK